MSEQAVYSGLDGIDAFRAHLARTHPEKLGLPPRGRLQPRRYWRPVLARLYGIRPWEMGGLTLRELDLIVDDLEALADEDD